MSYKAAEGASADTNYTTSSVVVTRVFCGLQLDFLSLLRLKYKPDFLRTEDVYKMVKRLQYHAARRSVKKYRQMRTLSKQIRLGYARLG